MMKKKTIVDIFEESICKVVCQLINNGVKPTPLVTGDIGEGQIYVQVFSKHHLGLVPSKIDGYRVLARYVKPEKKKT